MESFLRQSFLNMLISTMIDISSLLSIQIFLLITTLCLANENVYVMGYLDKAVADDLDMYPELQGGIAVGPMNKVQTTRGMEYVYGTIGAVLNYRGKRVIISCFHVLGPEGIFQQNAQIGQPPGERYVARLYMASFIGNLDVALAVVNSSVPVRSSIHSMPPPKKFATKADIDLIKQNKIPVMKRGIRSGTTTGKIFTQWHDVPIEVNYPFHRSGLKLYLKEQLEIHTDPPGGTFSEEMDSGSFVVTSDGVVVGMLVAGTGPRSFVTPSYLITSYFGPDLKLL